MRIQIIHNNTWLDIENSPIGPIKNPLEALLSIHVSVKLENIIFISDKYLSITKYLYKLRNY